MVGDIALGSDRARVRLSLVASQGDGASGLSLTAGNFLADSGFFTNLKQVHLKVFCSPTFLMCSRNLVTFRLLVAENSPHHCMDDTGD